LHDLLARDRREFALAVIVVAGELTLGVLQGIALGVALSLLMLTHRTGHPQGLCSANCRGPRPIATSGITPLNAHLPRIADLARRRRPV